MNYRTLNIEEIIAWCKENNQVQWIKDKVHETRKDKDGNERAITFIEVKREFAKTFMPEILPVAKPKRKTMLELVDEL